MNPQQTFNGLMAYHNAKHLAKLEGFGSGIEARG